MYKCEITGCQSHLMQKFCKFGKIAQYLAGLYYIYSIQIRVQMIPSQMTFLTNQGSALENKILRVKYNFKVSLYINPNSVTCLLSKTSRKHRCSNPSCHQCNTFTGLGLSAQSLDFQQIDNASMTIILFFCLEIINS